MNCSFFLLQSKLGQRPKVDEDTNFSLVCAGGNQHLHHAIDAPVSAQNVQGPQGHANLVRICGVASSPDLAVFFSFLCRSWCRRSQRVVVLVSGRAARDWLVNAGFVKNRGVRVVVVTVGCTEAHRTVEPQKMFQTLSSDTRRPVPRCLPRGVHPKGRRRECAFASRARPCFNIRIQTLRWSTSSSSKVWNKRWSSGELLW